jgi:hypothetical protein
VERYGKGSVDRVGGLWVLHLKGTSFERGLQHGTLMRYRVREALGFYRTLPEMLASRALPEGSYRLRALIRLKRSLVKRLMANRDSDALEEMRGLAVGLGMREEELAETLVLADLMQWAGALAERRRKAGPPVLPGFGCTSAIRETPSNGLIFGRNFDFWGAGYWDANPAVIFHHPDHGKAFCSIATAGMPNGGITAINEDGLAVAVHQHGSRDSSLKGTPILDIAHSLIRRASCVEEAIELAAGFKATGGGTLAVAGGSPRGAAIIEMSSARQVVRLPDEHALVASNYFIDEELSSRELQANVSSTLSDHARYRRALDLITHERITPQRMAGLLGDHYDPLAGRERSAGFSISRITNMSSVVFSLHDRRLWVSESPAPTSKGGFVGFDLDAELQGRRSSGNRLEGTKPPALKTTSAQDKYLDAYKEYINSGDLNRVLMIVGGCASIDPSEPTFPFMEAVLRAMLGNFRGALAAVERALELENVGAKKKVELLWKARIMDLSERRESAVKIYSELAEDPESPAVIASAASKAKRRPFREKEVLGLMLDLTNGDTFER